jgi:hypothetical protein
LGSLRAFVIGVIAAALAAFSAAPALGAVRYASPTGSGLEPCNPTACSLAKAVNSASDGDQVILAPGTYSTTTEIILNHPIDVGGEAGAAAPTIGLREVQVRVENAGAVLHDVRLEITEEGMARALVVNGGTVERVFATSPEHSSICEVEAGLLRDSVCWGQLSVSALESGASHVTLRNVTATPLLVGASGGDLTLDAANVIAHSLDSQHADLEIDVNTNGSATASFANSNYATVSTSLSAGTEYTYTAPGTNGNQTAPPQFVDAASGDFRELASSPTVDAGLADSLLGATALAGEARSLPACIGGTPIPDIGAYEYVPTVACPSPPSPPTPSPPSNAFRFGKLKRDKKKGTARLTVNFPGPGTFSLTGKGVVAKRSVVVTGAGNGALTIRPKGRWRRVLLRKGKVKLKIALTFTPSGGEARTRTRVVKLVKRLGR